jgi:DNA-binding transcriptional LysR family regulator
MITNITRLRHITAVARTGSFTRAAEEEAISQPALSRSIQSLEAEYGVKLFERGQGGVSLTPAGSLAVEQAKNVLSAAAELDRNMALFGRGEAGRLAVGFGPLVASLLLPGLGKHLLGGETNLQFITRVSPADQLVGDLFDGTLDAIIGNSGHLSQIPGVTQQQLGRIKLAIVVRKGHPLEGCDALRLDELADFPIATAIEGPNGFSQSSAGCFVSENFHILREVVQQTNCVWLTTPAFHSGRAGGGQFVQLPVTDLEPSETDIWIAQRRGQSHSPALAALTAACAEILQASG